MIKTYKSESVTSFTLTIRDGYYFRVRFVPYSYGGGIYTTDKEDVQKAIEAYKEFGRTITLVSEQKTESKEEKKVTETEAKNTEVEVNDIEDARDYLIEHCGYTKTKLRTKIAIMEAAQDKNITFVGI